MARAGRVAVGEFVEHKQRGPARERGVEIEFLEDAAAIFARAAREDFQVERGCGATLSTPWL